MTDLGQNGDQNRRPISDQLHKTVDDKRWTYGRMGRTNTDDGRDNDHDGKNDSDNNEQR